MQYRLALDIGTASVALVAYSLDQHGQPQDVAYNRLIIFSEPLLPAKAGGIGELKNAARRQARQMRRVIERRARRQRRIAHLFPLVGLRSEDVPPDDGQYLHEARANAIRQKVSLPDLMRVFLRMAKNRGYSGGFRVKKESVEEGKLEGRINDLKREMVALGSHAVGQYLYHRFKQGLPLKPIYATRDQYQEEFDQIWVEQEKRHPVLRGQYDGRSLRDIFREAIFFQRPLKSVAPMVGMCELTGLRRSPWAQMAAQQFRIEKQIADLRWGGGKSTKGLSEEQKGVIRKILDKQASISFESLYKKFEKVGCPKPPNKCLNFDRLNREELKGNTTLATFRKLDLLDEWRGLNERAQEQVFNFLADMGSPEIVDQPNWHANLTTGEGKPRQLLPETVGFINKMAGTSKFARLGKMGFDSGRAAYSYAAMKKLIPQLQAGKNEEEAIREAFPKARAAQTLKERLGKPRKTGNPVVDVALRQVRYAVNQAIMDLCARPEQVAVELARAMSLGRKRRGEIELRQRAQRKAREKAKEAIEKTGGRASPGNIRRYLLWEEQETFCVYCGQRINMADALDGGETNFDHIQPRKRTFVGQKFNELVLAHRRCNDEKGDRTPFEAWEHNPERWAIIESRAKALWKKNRYKTNLILRKTFEDASIEGFADRQLHATSWIAKLTAQWLKKICPNVWTNAGQLTFDLRLQWGLDTVIAAVRASEGQPLADEGGLNDKRMDHRHHLIDAMVIGLIDRGLVKKAAENYKRAAERGEKMSFRADPPVPDIRQKALGVIGQCVVHHRPDRHPDGRLFQDFAYGLLPGSEGEPNRITRRVELKDLVGKDVKKTRENLETIAGGALREYILRIYDERIAQGKTPAQALTEDPIHYPQENNPPVKRVKVVHQDAGESVYVVRHRSRQGEHYKYLVPEGNAYIEIASDGKAVRPRLVPPHGALREKGQPVPAGWMRIYKGDTVVDRRSGRRYVVKQIKSASGGKLILMPVTETKEVREANAADGLLTVSGRALRHLALVN